MDDKHYTITEADAELIASKLWKRFETEFQLGVGSSALKMGRKLIWTVILMFIAYSVGTGKLPSMAIANSQ